MLGSGFLALCVSLHLPLSIFSVSSTVYGQFVLVLTIYFQVDFLE